KATREIPVGGQTRVTLLPTVANERPNRAAAQYTIASSRDLKRERPTCSRSLAGSRSCIAYRPGSRSVAGSPCRAVTPAYAVCAGSKGRPPEEEGRAGAYWTRRDDVMSLTPLFLRHTLLPPSLTDAPRSPSLS